MIRHTGLALTALGLCGIACVDVEPYPTDGILLGALLPFTGDLAATGTNLERAAMLAAARVNDAGGVSGQHLRILADDTHSDSERGFRVATELIEQHPVRAILGPEDADLADRMRALVTERDLLHLLPGTTAPPLRADAGLKQRWFRLAPTAEMVGCALARRISAENFRDLLVVHQGDRYNLALTNSLVNEYRLDSGVSVTVLNLDRGSISQIVQEGRRNNPSAIALMAFPITAASFVSEWSVAAETRLQWILPPALDSEVFLLNVPPGSLDRAIGVSPAPPFGAAQDFQVAFAEFWSGDTPTIGAYYYYDAVALLALAMESATASGYGTLDGHLREVSRFPGDIIRWNELSRGLELARRGSDVNYHGVGGPVDLQENGDVPDGILQFWRIENGAINPTSLNSYRCSSI